MITTSDLQIRPYQESDFAFTFRMAQSAEVSRFVRPVATDEAPVRERMRVSTEYSVKNPGMGPFIIEQKQDGMAIGNMILRHTNWDNRREVEVGYSIESAHWGKGYATQALLGLMDYARTKFNPPVIVAFTDPANIASNRVLEKCGFINTGTEFIYEYDLFRWEFLP